MSPLAIFVIIICISLFLISLCIAMFIAAKHASEKEFRCIHCNRLFSPRKRDAFGAAYSFGDRSVLVRCPHCRHKARLHPKDEYTTDKPKRKSAGT
ncbi:MAG: hypothetical protein IJW21_04740 [Clostridia bacterium]|nr:hypothetical protein [Clostridia bacterium]